jgi:hypothetical protein
MKKSSLMRKNLVKQAIAERNIMVSCERNVVVLRWRQFCFCCLVCFKGGDIESVRREAVLCVRIGDEDLFCDGIRDRWRLQVRLFVRSFVVESLRNVGFACAMQLVVDGDRSV